MNLSSYISGGQKIKAGSHGATIKVSAKLYSFRSLGFSSKLKGLLAEISCLTDMEVCLIQINGICTFLLLFFFNEV